MGDAVRAMVLALQENERQKLIDAVIEVLQPQLLKKMDEKLDEKLQPLMGWHDAMNMTMLEDEALNITAEELREFLKTPEKVFSTPEKNIRMKRAPSPQSINTRPKVKHVLEEEERQAEEKAKEEESTAAAEAAESFSRMTYKPPTPPKKQ